MKKLTLLALLIASTITTQAQIVKNSLNLPTIPGYELLKCDFHIHTVYSDGAVWPLTRIDEAVVEGLDAIALTEHIEYRPKLKEFTSQDHNHSYELTKKYAAANNILLIQGTEVTRRMAPGHFNAIFMKDANPMESFVNPKDTRDGSNIVPTLDAAKEQGAFVFWNHPWFQHPKNISEWAPIHEELFEKGLISGIEVVNGERYDPVILQWCLDKNLTVISNSDIHTPMYLAPGVYRAMTLVFANERSQDGIHNALKNRQSVAYMEGNIYGAQQWIDKIVANSLKYNLQKTGNKNYALTIKNISGIPYTLKMNDNNDISPRLRSVLNTFTIPANGEVIIPINQNKESKATQTKLVTEVLNAQIGANKPLPFSFDLKLQ